MSAVFLAFPGYEPTVSGVHVAFDGVELWNLKDISLTDFVSRFEARVPIINRDNRPNPFVGSDYDTFRSSYEASTWGILLPDVSSDYLSVRYVSYLLLSLYSGKFLPVMFHATELGITVERDQIHVGMAAQFHKEDLQFVSEAFSKFYRTLYGVVASTQWNSGTVLAWTSEKWRLCLASILFLDLARYQYSKQVLTWPKECSDLVTLHELLLSTKERDRGASKMPRRIRALLGAHIGRPTSDIHDQLSRLFDFRSEFVHGRFFQRLKEQTRRAGNGDLADVPHVEFKFLRDQTLLARQVFVAVLYLASDIGRLPALGSSNAPVQEAVARAEQDPRLRRSLQTMTDSILKLLPVSSAGST